MQRNARPCPSIMRNACYSSLRGKLYAHLLPPMKDNDDTPLFLLYLDLSNTIMSIDEYIHVLSSCVHLQTYKNATTLVQYA